MPPSLVLARELYSYYNKSKECLKVVEILSDPLPQFTFYHIRISQKVFKKEKLSSSRIHCFYIILRNECRKKKKKKFVLSSSLRIPDSYLLVSPRPLSPSGTPDLTCLGIDSLINTLKSKTFLLFFPPFLSYHNCIVILWFLQPLDSSILLYGHLDVSTSDTNLMYHQSANSNASMVTPTEKSTCIHRSVLWGKLIPLTIHLMEKIFTYWGTGNLYMVQLEYGVNSNHLIHDLWNTQHMAFNH